MAMELEYVFKILIMLIVVAVIIGLILTFRDQIVALTKSYLQNFAGGNQTPQFPKLIDKGTGTFISGEVASYVQSCYTAINSLSVDQRVTTNCYILRGNFNANQDDILRSITDSSLKNKVNITADFTKGAVIIQYLDPQGIVLVK